MISNNSSILTGLGLSNAAGNLIVLGFVIAGGIVLLITKRERIRRFWDWTSVGWGLFLVGLFLFLNQFSQYLESFSSWATLILAIAAFWSIERNIRQSRERRDDDVAREERIDKEKRLSEIINWAVEVASCRVSIDADDITQTKYLYEMQAIRALYIRRIVNKDNPDLKKAVGGLIKELGKHIALLTEYLDIASKEADDIEKIKAKVEEAYQHNGVVTRSYDKVIEEATKVKLALLPR